VRRLGTKSLWSFNAVSCCLCLCLISCSSNRFGDHPPFPVSGQVLVNGQPAKGAWVVFHHLGDWGTKSIVPQAWTDDDGRFVMFTYEVADGAPAGDYRVTVEWPAYRYGRNWGPDKLGGKFANAETSGLKAQVSAGRNELEAFALQADPEVIKQGDIRAEAEKKKSRRKGRF
jgi:hypothetical protein